MKGVIRPDKSSDWTIKKIADRSARRRSATPFADIDQFLAEGVAIDSEWEAHAGPRRRTTAFLPDIKFSVPLTGFQGCVVALRHTSGALTFHAPQQKQQRNRDSSKKEAHFEIALAASSGQRRGIVSSAVKVSVLKIADAISGAVLPPIVKAWEKKSWSRRKLSEGWFYVSGTALRSGKLVAATPRLSDMANGRALLFLHGTFSDAATAFRGLAENGFFEVVAPFYGQAIYAFNHFSLSKSPEDNARELLAALPAQGMTFDVITHSRGGLVLRNLVERKSILGDDAKRFLLGRGVMVACPSKGTPLATPQAFADSTSWIANIAEQFPDNPMTTAVEWVAEAIKWLGAQSRVIPGLNAMEIDGPTMKELNRGVPTGVDYSALVADYAPESDWAARIGDLAIDSFFGGANDLVVPTAGGWRAGPIGTDDMVIPVEKIGLFGEGGNLSPTTSINHLNFFDCPETAAFLGRAVLGQPQGLPIPARLKSSPRRRSDRDSGKVAAIDVLAAAPRVPDGLGSEHFSIASPTFSDAFSITLIATRSKISNQGGKAAEEEAIPDELMILATYGGARVATRYQTTGGEHGARFKRIISAQRAIRGYVAQEQNAKLPTDEKLREFGIDLFEALFSPKIKRLYDAARSRERSGALNILFTSMKGWLADLPWEYAFDTDRKTYLATEDIHFVRNVMTEVPAERLLPRPGPLRMLVVSAQPKGESRLSIEEEKAIIRRGFSNLEQAGLVEVTPLAAASAQTLQDAVVLKEYDIVHLISHGMFDEETNEASLLLENEDGTGQSINRRTAREVLCNRGIRLVFLNACESGRGALDDANAGMAQSLVEGGVPAVVANQFSVLDVSATEFAQKFYWALAHGLTLGQATREARIAVNCSIAGENLDWAIPVLYARDPESKLCEVRKDESWPLSSYQTSSVPSSGRRTTEQPDGPKRVAVWDMAGKFPKLSATLNVLNKKQNRFNFFLAALSTPISTIKRVKGTMHFDADFAFRRLRRAVRDLDADQLFCILDKPITYDDGREDFYYAWWPDEVERNPVVFFSVDFLTTQLSGRVADRIIANAAAIGVMGALTGVETRTNAPRDSILFSNDERNFELLYSHQRIDPASKAILTKKGKGLHPLSKEDLEAIENILNAFW